MRKAGRLKDMGAPWRDESDEERAKEQELIDAIYEAFVARVVAARRLPVERVRELATGEVWLGTRALELGLVDEIGDLERAVEVAAPVRRSGREVVAGSVAAAAAGQAGGPVRRTGSARHRRRDRSAAGGSLPGHVSRR